MDKTKTRICLILEGSYPYVHGGVSVWMHQLIQQMPDREFVLWCIGAHAADKGKYAYELPANVTEIHEVFLDDALKVKPRHDREYRFSETQMKALYELLNCGRPDWKEIFHLYQDEHMDPAGFLMNRSFLKILTEVCQKNYPYAAFADLFHTVRSMMLTVLYLCGTKVPEADLYHAICTGYGGLLGALGHYTYKKPLLLTEHGIYSREREEEIIRADWVPPAFKPLWIRFFYMLSDLIYQNALSVSSLFTRARLTQIDLGADPKKCLVISNGIQYERFSHIPDKMEDGWIDIGAVIRIAPIKDVKTLIYAFHELALRMDNVRLHILGGIDDEEYNQECLNLVDMLHEGRILFPGRQDVTKYFEKLDFTVLTSLSEGQPLSVLESFAAGRPAVTTDVGCCRELIYGGPGDAFGQAGIVVPPMNREGLADAMELLSRDRLRRKTMGENGKNRVASLYLHKAMIKKYDEVYEAAFSDSPEEAVSGLVSRQQNGQTRKSGLLSSGREET